LAYRVKKDIEGKDLGSRLRKTLDYEIEVLEHQFARNGVRTFGGKARFLDTNRICVTDRDGEEHVFSFDFAVIAVGTTPYRPANIPFNDHSVVDSDSLVSEPRVPKSLTVVGAGVIGIEYATIFSALDVPVTIIEPKDTILDFIDREIIEEFTHDLRQRGVTLRLGAKVDQVELDGVGWPVAILADGRRIRSDMLLYAAGRSGATADLGLENAGITPQDRGRLKVDPATFQTNVRNIYAAGDVIGFPSLASTSMEQGRIAALHACGAAMHPAPEFFPYGIYAVPEISTVGLTEQQVRAQGIPYESGVARFRETSRGHIMGLQSGMMKMMFSLEDRKLLGVHIVGEGATELIHIGQAVLNLGGTLDYFVENAFNYPTLAEAYKIAALDAWNRMPRQTLPLAEAKA
ncbi:MAG: Si-specific transhydrogenase, partial [Devosia sp.]|nr:Si-specific transhydrogenase [Devosia sp.]